MKIRFKDLSKGDVFKICGYSTKLVKLEDKFCGNAKVIETKVPSELNKIKWIHGSVYVEKL